MATETTSEDDDLPTLEAPVSEVLAAITGRPASDFKPPEDVEYPHPDDLEIVEPED